VSDGPRIDFFFDENTHTYSTPMHGVIPGCTRVLDQGGLVSFDHVSRDILERKSELGREVHKACHLFNQGKSLICDPTVDGYLKSWIKTAKTLKFIPRQSEFRQIATVNGMLFGMQIDVEGLVLNEDTIIDLKIGQVCPHHGIQLAGYALGLYHPRLETPAGRFRTRKRIIAQLQEDGSLAKLHRFEAKSDFDVFVSALYTTYWKMQNAKFYREINQ